MNSNEWYEYRRACEDEADALSDCNSLLIGALRSHPDFGTHRNYFEKLIETIESDVGTGGFKQAVLLENGRTVTYRFSYPVAIGQGFRTTAYLERFKVSVPSWVRKRHPFTLICLCRLALDEGEPLPNIPEELFEPPHAQRLRELREEADLLLAKGIRAARNSEWLEALRAQLDNLGPSLAVICRQSKLSE